MKRILFSLIVSLVVTGICFANGATDLNGAKTFKIKIGNEFSLDSPKNQALLEFEKYVEATSNGNIQVEIFPGGVLGSESEMQESMKMGNLEAFTGGPFDSESVKLNLILMPFFFENQEALMRVVKSDIGAAIMKDGEKNGLKILALGDGGARQITNNVREIKNPADMEGLKLRTPGIESIIKCMQTLGANTVSIPFADTYMALKTGVADGQENPLSSIVDSKFYEVQKFMTNINYQFHPEVLCMNLDFYNSLPEDFQKIVSDGAWIFVEKENELRKSKDIEYYKAIEESGTIIYTPTAAEKKEFMDACTPVYEYFIDKGVFTRNELEEVRQISQNK